MRHGPGFQVLLMDPNVFATLTGCQIRHGGCNERQLTYSARGGQRGAGQLGLGDCVASCLNRNTASMWRCGVTSVLCPSTVASVWFPLSVLHFANTLQGLADYCVNVLSYTASPGPGQPLPRPSLERILTSTHQPLSHSCHLRSRRRKTMTPETPSLIFQVTELFDSSHAGRRMACPKPPSHPLNPVCGDILGG